MKRKFHKWRMSHRWTDILFTYMVCIGGLLLVNYIIDVWDTYMLVIFIIIILLLPIVK